MAERRMFTQKITDSDAFTEMPLSAQALYFHLNMHADDDGFLNNANKIRKSINASEDDFKLLVLKRFVIPFESGVVVIKHWRMHNLLRKDRYTPTQYQEEFAQLELRKTDNAYTEKLCTEIDWQPNDNQMTTQYSIGKDSIGKDNISIINTLSDSPDEKEKENKINLKNEVYQDIFNYWISMEATIKHRELTDLQKKAIDKAIKRYQIVQIKDAIAHYDLMLRSNYYFNYKWSLEDFLSQSNALPCFTEEGSKWATFMDEVNKNPMLLPKEDRPEERHQAPQCFKDFYNSL